MLKGDKKHISFKTSFSLLSIIPAVISNIIPSFDKYNTVCKGKFTH